MTDEATQNVQAARSLLSDFEEVGPEERDGAIHHAIEELKNAQRKVDDY